MILFRCNASPTVGLGHLVRCRSLAAALKDQGESCIMVGPSKEYQTIDDEEIFTEWFPKLIWDSSLEDAKELAQLAHRYSVGTVVLDDYRVDEEYQIFLRNTGLHWLQFDGRAHQPLWADIVLNTSPGAREKEYKPVLRTNATLLFGPKYALLRPEFKVVKLRTANRPLEQVLVTFGGGDDLGANIFVLKTLHSQTPAQIRFLIISGETNPRNSEIAMWIKQYGMGRVILKVNPPLIAPLIASCDFAVMAGGTTIYEVACCGLEMILIAIADNQVKHSLAWEKTGIACYLGMFGAVDEEKLTNALKVHEKSRLTRKKSEEFDPRFVDGFGAERIANHLISLNQKFMKHSPASVTFT